VTVRVLLLRGIVRVLRTSVNSPAISRAVKTQTVALPLLFMLVASGEVHAQSAGAAFLMLPVGARSVGSGEATAADTLGIDGAWWNPASLAVIKRTELALNGSQSFEGTNAALGYARTSRALGTIAISASILDYGDQGVTDPVGGGDVGTISIRSSIAMVSYATPVGSRLRLGLSYKYARLAFTCSGLCGSTPQFVGASSALDVGAQYVVPTTLPFTVGAALRHIGPDFQVKDAEQADPLPRTWQVGASARMPSTVLARADATLDVMTDLLGSLAYRSMSARVGGVLTYRGKYALRAGYTLVEGERGGPSVGLGAYLSDGLVVDVARRFDGFSAQAGQAPTFVTLRFLF
jgi:hypothetical protein